MACHKPVFKADQDLITNLHCCHSSRSCCLLASLMPEFAFAAIRAGSFPRPLSAGFVNVMQQLSTFRLILTTALTSTWHAPIVCPHTYCWHMGCAAAAAAWAFLTWLSASHQLPPQTTAQSTQWIPQTNA